MLGCHLMRFPKPILFISFFLGALFSFGWIQYAEDTHCVD